MQLHNLSYYLVVVFNLSWSGVDLFFVLSGFLIGGILLDNRNANNYYKTFYIRRVCRIFPLYYLFLFVYVVTIWLKPVPLMESSLREFSESTIPLWAYILYAQNIFMALQSHFGPMWLAPTWSLAVEEQFYLMLPLLVRNLTPKKLLVVALGLVLLAPVLRFMLFFASSGVAVDTYALLPTRIDSLMAGVICACFMREHSWREILRRNVRILYLILFCLLGYIGWLTLIYTYPAAYQHTFMGYSMLALLYSCFLLISLLERKGAISYLVTRATLCQIGVLAYGIYLFHCPVNIVLQSCFLDRSHDMGSFRGVGITILSLVGTLILAFISWNLFEKKIVKWGHSFSYGGEQYAGGKVWYSKVHPVSARSR